MRFTPRRVAIMAASIMMGWGTLSMATDKTPDALKNLTLAGEKVAVQQIEPAPMNGIYRVVLQSGEAFYADASGRFLVVGDMYENTPQGLINITERAQARERIALLKNINVHDTIVYKPAGKVSAVITVFTDGTCAYCRKLHEELPALTKAGVEVHYMAFPRKGPESDSARQLAQVLCSKQPTEALSAVMRGDSLSNDGQRCQGRVTQQFELGRQLGVRGTPAIFLEDGRLLSGYAPSERLLQQIGVKR